MTSIPSARSTTQTAELTTYYRRSWARNVTDEELRQTIDVLEWRLRTDDPDSDDAHTLELAQAQIDAANMELDFRLRRGLVRGHIDNGWPRAFLDEVKARVRLEDEISLALVTRRHGSILKAVCPFHPDRNPSLVVWTESQWWRCFGCQAGGDVFAWIQAWLPTDFRGAVMYLSARAGVPLPQDTQQSTGAPFEYRRRPSVLS